MFDDEIENVSADANSSEDAQKASIVRVHTREQLLSLDAIDGLAERLNELDLPRRRVVEWMTDTLYGWIEAGGVVLSGEGKVIDIYPGIVDDAHGEDGSAIWISEQRRRTENSPRRRPRQSMWLRMALYDAAFQIAFGTSIIEQNNREISANRNGSSL